MNFFILGLFSQIAKKKGIRLDYHYPTFSYVFIMKHRYLLVDVDLMTMFQRCSEKKVIVIWVGTTLKPNSLYKLVLNLKRKNESKQAIGNNVVDDNVLGDNITLIIGSR